MNILRNLTMVAAAAALSACATDALHASPHPAIVRTATTAVLPFANYTTTPGAGERAASITESLLMTHGLAHTVVVNAGASNGLPLERLPNIPAALARAGRMGARYAMEGSVEEWRYTIGLDGEPAVAVTLNLVDVRTGQILWTATGSRSGNPRESVGVLAEDTVNAMLNRLLP